MAKQPKDEGKSNIKKIRVGTGIIKNLSSTFYPNPKMIFDEIITNARDAMAKNVRLFIGEKKIIIEDDGEGMSRQELIHFFFISHSDKPEQQTKKKGGLKREIIGKFGIGKLSLYQICRCFEITTWKNNNESNAVFNFDDFEKEEFVDDFSLKIISESSSSRHAGTRIVLKDLKRAISARAIKRHLTRTMPLTNDFKVIIEGIDLSRPVELRSEDVLAGNVYKKYPVDDFEEGVGKIKGMIAYKKSERGGEFGIFVRVLGRLVNLNNPHGIINFSSLTSAQQFARRIYADLNVNGLNDALQTNRAGFIVDHPVYISFQIWLKKKLNLLNKEVGKEWREGRGEVEKKVVEDLVSSIFTVKKKKVTKEPMPLIKEERPSKKTSFDKSEQTKDKESLKIPTKDEKEKDLIIQGNSYNISVSDLGEEEPEAILNKESNTIIINSLHPLYNIARSQGRVWGVQYHSIRAAIVIIALDKSKNLDDFKRKYQELIKNSEEVAKNIQKRIVTLY